MDSSGTSRVSPSDTFSNDETIANYYALASQLGDPQWSPSVSPSTPTRPPTRIPHPQSGTPKGSSRKQRPDSPAPEAYRHSLPVMQTRQPTFPQFVFPNPSNVGPSEHAPTIVDRPFLMPHERPDFQVRMPARLSEPGTVSDDTPLDPAVKQHLQEIFEGPGEWPKQTKLPDPNVTLSSIPASSASRPSRSFLPKSRDFSGIAMSARNFFKKPKSGMPASANGYQVKIPDIKPEDYDDPRNVFEAMPSAYWTGRFMSIRDKMLNEVGWAPEDLAEPNSPASGSCDITNKDRMAYEVCDRIRGFCKTEEALKSFWHFQQHFAATHHLSKLIDGYDPKDSTIEKPWIPRERLPVSATTTNVTVEREVPTRIPRAARSVTNILSRFKPEKGGGNDKKAVDKNKENVKRPAWR